MSEYHRLYRQQGWYFFTIVTYNREKILIQPYNLIQRRQSFRYGMKKLPLKMDAEKKVWQRRFWKHLLRNKADWHAHMDYTLTILSNMVMLKVRTTGRTDHSSCRKAGIIYGRLGSKGSFKY